MEVRKIRRKKSRKQLLRWFLGDSEIPRYLSLFIVTVLIVNIPLDELYSEYVLIPLVQAWGERKYKVWSSL